MKEKLENHIEIVVWLDIYIYIYIYLEFTDITDSFAMMQKLTKNILNNKFNKFTIKCSEQPLKLPISARHCSVLTGIIS